MSEVNLTNLVMMGLAEHRHRIGLIHAEPVGNGTITGSLDDGSTFAISVVQRG